MPEPTPVRSGKSPQPPLLFLGCLLVGSGLGVLHPLGLALPVRLRMAGCLLLWIPAGGLAAWALATFKRHDTTPRPNGTATALLSSGPYGFTRNPLYVSLSALFAGVGLLLDSFWLLALTPALVALLDRLVIAREEIRLLGQFGAEYQAYKDRVRRWF